jgi:hypothetical protein
VNKRTFAIAAALFGGAGIACNRPMFDKPRPAVERFNPNILPSRFRVVATVAGDNTRPGLQISATARERLADSGFTAIRRSGRWDSQAEAVRQICSPGQIPPVDGVLFIWYNRLELRDCTTEGAAYEIAGQGSVGIQGMVDRLVMWLRRDDGPATPTTPPPP